MIPDRVFDEFVDVIFNFQSTDSIEKEGTDIFSTSNWYLLEVQNVVSNLSVF